ncbi:MAG TPA: hypothetical protein VMH61_03030 [Candidatus Acidoferrales bacterium]|nr:hypothetical protein [Candidatus Acidoferrales bacterium]
MIARPPVPRFATAPRALPLAGLVLLGALAGCGSDGTTLTVINRSHARLESLRVCAERDSAFVPALAPGDSAVVRPPWSDDDVIQLRGLAAGEPLRPMMGGFVEAGDRVAVIVDSTGFVTVEVRAEPQ